MAHYLIRLEDNLGNVLQELEDRTDCIDLKLAPVSKSVNGHLQYLDPYGTTVFNAVQAESVVREIEQSVIKCSNELEAGFLEGLHNILAACDAEPHLHVKFYGD